ncbi:hypothetical protein H2199_001203 [Coniosporium tulheliwenetii]|uniref:Uncharacterized protein n=1 Tax=Coniosporium tulheliwenetii TaxID=3383036 RepID=A0ACC2ZLC4_9PEZI|nr:hypothetical protein H2199_001203 [Cladosporium sp. JES 115]
MSLQAKYEQFLNSSSTSALADNASINYITTLTTINGAVPISKHLSAQAKQVKKTGEKVLSALESADSLCLDVHIVKFDADEKIRQIRLYWDQGSLLKQVDVIGARARNWPIRDGKDQARLIESSASSTGGPALATSGRSKSSSQAQNGATSSGRPHSNSNISATGDPHASLSLFQSRPISRENNFPSTIAPRASAKPPPREYGELFAGEETAQSPGSALLSPSPTKSAHGIKAKGGAGKNFQPNRLFDENEPGTPTKSPEKLKKADPNKYKHFEFSDAADTTTKSKSEAKGGTRGNKHESNWDFESFVTPEKVPAKTSGREVSHFGWSDDEGEKSPVHRPIVHAPCPDAESRHFEFADDGTPMADKPAPSKAGNLSNKGMGLYQDHVIDNDDSSAPGKNKGSQQLKDVTTNANNESRRKNFGSQFDMTDNSPSLTGDKKADGGENGQKIRIAGNGMGARKNLESHWDLYDHGPAPAANKGIKTANDGMGGRKGSGRTWGFGDDSDEEAGKFEGFQGNGRKRVPAQPQKDFWDF